MKNITGRVLALQSVFVLAFVSGGADVCAAEFIESAGTVMTLALPAAAGGFAVSSSDRRGGIRLLESTAVSVGVTYGLKQLVDQERPDGGAHSFPSMHTSVSFTAAEFMRRRYGMAYGIPAYAAAAFVGYSRVEARRHHLHDVLAGGVIGVISAALLTRPDKGMSMSGTMVGDAVGVSLVSSW